MNKILITQGFNHNSRNIFLVFMILFIISLFLLQIERSMALRIKELCREKQIAMKDIAKRLGINPITLSQSLNGNPTLTRLQEVAGILGVSVPELFEETSFVSKEVHGCLFVDGNPVIVKNQEDLQKLVKTLGIE